MTEQMDWRAKQPSKVACVLEGLSVEELETLQAGIKRRISHRHLQRGSTKQSS